MTWFKVDDTAHMHPKLIKAGNAALGLWLRAGSYAAQHLTEGVVPAVVAQLYGTAPQARKLVTAGLWHEHGHTCPRCAQPPAGDYVMHDYLIYNPSRAKVEDSRRREAERKARGRAAQAEKRSESSANRPRIDVDPATENLENAANRNAFSGETAGQRRVSHPDGSDVSQWSRPDPTRSTSYGGTNPPAPRGTPGPAEALLARWWETYGRTTAQTRTQVGRTIAAALANGLDADELWAALDRLGALSKPISAGTLQFALADVRKTQQPPQAPGGNVVPLRPTADRPGRAEQAASWYADLIAEENAQ